MSYQDDYDDTMPSGLPYDVPGQGGAGVPLPSPQPLSSPLAAASAGRPPTVTLAGLCLIADMLTFMTTFVLVLLYEDAFVAETTRQIGQQVPGFPPDAVPSFVRIALLMIAVVQLLISMLIALLAILLLRRRRIPWILATMISWLFLLGQIGSFASTANMAVPDSLRAVNALGQTMTGMSILMIATAAVCLVLPASVRWFRRR